jgi:hypothetical protein
MPRKIYISIPSLRCSIPRGFDLGFRVTGFPLIFER